MSQKGGTYELSASNMATTEVKFDGDMKYEASNSCETSATDLDISSSETSTQVSDDVHDKINEKEWVVVDDGKTDQKDDDKPVSSHHVYGSFNLQLGVGKWKFTVLSCEVNIKKEHEF